MADPFPFPKRRTIDYHSKDSMPLHPTNIDFSCAFIAGDRMPAGGGGQPRTCPFPSLSGRGGGQGQARAPDKAASSPHPSRGGEGDRTRRNCVAQTSSLLYRRLPVGRRSNCGRRLAVLAHTQTRGPRYSSLEVCATLNIPGVSTDGMAVGPGIILEAFCAGAGGCHCALLDRSPPTACPDPRPVAGSGAAPLSPRCCANSPPKDDKYRRRQR
jgi:hypothetical protein